MSWFTDLAGKAESLLEKVDSAAATALHTEHADNGSDKVTQELKPSRPVVKSEPVQFNNKANIHRVASEGSILGGPTVPIKPRLPVSGSRTPPRVTRTELKNDDKLFEFLNSNVPTSKERKPVKPKSLGERTAEVVSENSSSNGFVQADEVKGTPIRDDEETVKITPVYNGPSLPEPQQQDTPQYETSVSTNIGRQHQASDRVSNLELENKLLRKEVASLNEEMVAVVQRAKEADKRVKETEKQVQRSHEQLTTSEEIARQLRLKESDFTEALSAKDSQLAVLRVRIQEADQELNNRRRQIEEYQLERERLLKDHSDSAGVQSYALDTLKAKLEEAEGKCKVEEEARKKIQQESMEQIAKLQEEQETMAETLKNFQRKVQEEKNKSTEHMLALKNAKANFETTKQELKDYKDKAARILQAKDKVIASLRDGSKGEDMSGVSTTEYEEVSHERDMLKDEVNQMRYRMEQLKGDLQEVEQQQQAEADIAREKLEEFESALEDEKRRREVSEQQIEQHLLDLHNAQDEVQRSKSIFMGQIQERELEIQRLRNQVATKALISTSEEELENRVRALTENLIQKQTLIEALSTEKNSLVLQLERLEKQYRDVQASTAKIMSGAPATYDCFDDSDENTLSRVRSISSIMPSRLSDSRKVKTAVNEIDKFSIRLGLFLRRYPIARLFVIIYMVLLHLWVLIVLLTYQPEVHTTGSSSLPREPRP